jgi:hypothetical protein
MSDNGLSASSPQSSLLTLGVVLIASRFSRDTCNSVTEKLRHEKRLFSVHSEPLRIILSL